MRMSFASLVIFAAMTSSIALCSGNSPRGRESFNDGWLFLRCGTMPDGSFTPEPANLEGMAIPDSTWRTLDLPHDWGIEGPFRDDLPSNTGKLPWAGIGWYRKHFRLPESFGTKRMFIECDGAMSHAKLWLNGQFLGEWPYGYASFSFELTPFLRKDGDNILAARLENPPNSSRWYPGGGLYRNVWLVTTGPLHVAHWGIAVTTPRVTKNAATVKVRATFDNQTDLDEDVILSIAVDNADGTTAGTSRELPLHVLSDTVATTECLIDIPSPRLWSLKSPTRYIARTIIRKNGSVLDSVATPFGIRTVEFSATDGFLLNGERVRVNGVCNHHDLGPLGTAVSVRALERQLAILQEMGCNAIRTSHNPPAPELLDLCDRMGMLVLDEAFDCWETGKTPNDYSTLFKVWHESDIRALVRRDRNHPSVIAWSCGNEVREQSNGDLARKLVAIFHNEDPSRAVTAGCDNPAAGFNGFQKAVDIFGYNYKPHVYSRFRSMNPTVPLFGSETASCVSSNGEYFFPVINDKTQGAVGGQVSSYDLAAPPWATIPDVEFAAQDSNSTVMGEFVWTGFDYLGEPTPYYDDTCSSRSSYFGICDLCGFKKDRFYLYQSRWKPEQPMAHIAPHWNWPDRIGKVTPIQVYTSGDEAELFLNGRWLGRKVKGRYQYRLRWDDVVYTPGELKVVAYKNGNVWASDIVRTTDSSAKITLSPENNTLPADGNDLVYVVVRVTDEDGLAVPTASNRVKFTLDGPGIIAAVANGDPTDHDAFQSDNIRAFHGQCLVILRSMKNREGVLRLSASAEGLGSATVEIRTYKEAIHK